MKRTIFYALMFGCALALLAACGQAPATPTQAPPAVEEATEEPPTETIAPSPTETPTEVEETELPATETPTQEPTEEETEATGEVGDVEVLIVERCSECHSADRVFNADKTEDAWRATIDRMVDYGAVVSEEEKQAMIDWLVSRDE